MMKRHYTNPSMSVVTLRSAKILDSSWGDNEGNVGFRSDKANPEEAD